MDLSGKRVVVTGASRGIGEALARAFAAAGATVALVDRTEDAIGSLAAELGGTAHPADLSDTSQVATLVRRVEDDAGPIDILVNNAGVSGTGAAFPDTSEDNQRFVMQVNYLAPAELCRQVIPRMRSRAGGHIVNVSSMAGCVVIPGTVAYSASKAALSHFTAGLRADLRGLPIGTTLVELGPIPTDMLAEVEDYEPTERGFRRFYRLHLIVDVPRETVADEVVDAVRRGRRHVRIPKRAALFPMLSEAPRRTVELLLSGVPARAAPGTGPAALDERRPRAAQ